MSAHSASDVVRIHKVPLSWCQVLTSLLQSNNFLWLQACCPVMIMLGLCMTGLETPSTHVVIAVVFITVGTFIASYGVANLDVWGICTMIASLLFEVVRLILTQVLLVGLDCHPGEDLAACLIPCPVLLSFMELAVGHSGVRHPHV